jgi:hypothetical protein
MVRRAHEFNAFEQVGQEGGEELNELGGELRVYGRLLSHW